MRHDAVIFNLFGALVKSIPTADYAAMLPDLAGHLGAPCAAFTVAWRTPVTLASRGKLIS